jgi:hypothetical protein
VLVAGERLLVLTVYVVLAAAEVVFKGHSSMQLGRLQIPPTSLTISYIVSSRTSK